MSDELPSGRPTRARRSRWLVAGAVAVVVVLAAVLALVLRHDLRHYTLPSGAMLPTLSIGAKVAVDPSRRAPSDGDIVVFHPPVGAEPIPPICGARGEGEGYARPCGVPAPPESSEVFLKRVVAGPGTISIAGGRATVDGHPEQAAYLLPCADAPACDFRIAITVPAGDYFMLGDNRGASYDSRFWGPVPQAWIIGTVVDCSLLELVCHPKH